MIPISFYKTAAGKCPVPEWLDNLPEDERIKILEDIQTLRRGWPTGMPFKMVKKCRDGIWEIRTSHQNRISRVLFAMFPLYNDEGCKVKHAILLHGFIKKDEKIPEKDMKLAIKRLKTL